LPAGRTITAVLFDWGGTLTPWHDVDLYAQWHAYAAAYDPARADQLAGALRDAELAAWQRATEHHRSGTLDDLLRAAGVHPAGPRHERALAAYLDFWAPYTYVDPEAPALLAALRERGLRVGVLSNTYWPRHHHESVFHRDGVLHLIDAAVYTSEIAWTKPHPEAFGAALRAVRVDDPRSAVFVGDRPYDDISGAAAVGMRTIFVPHSAASLRRPPGRHRGPVGRGAGHRRRLARPGLNRSQRPGNGTVGGASGAASRRQRAAATAASDSAASALARAARSVVDAVAASQAAATPSSSRPARRRAAGRPVTGNGSR